MSIGNRIKELRESSGLSQGEMASMLSVSRQAVSKWENDQSSPDTIRLIQLADVLNTEVEFLATGKKPVYEHPIVVNLVKRDTQIQERIFEKPVIKRVYRVKYIRNPIEFVAVFISGLLVGLVISLLF